MCTVAMKKTNLFIFIFTVVKKKLKKRESYFISFLRRDHIVVIDACYHVTDSAIVFRLLIFETYRQLYSFFFTKEKVL